MFERVWHLDDEREHHPDDEWQGGDRIDQDQSDIGVEQADAQTKQRTGRVWDQDRVVDKDRDRDDDRRNHADGQNGVAKIPAADVEARDRVCKQSAEQEREQGGCRTHQHGIAEALPDRECLLRRLPAERRVDATECEDLREIMQCGDARQPVRRPGHPLAGILERGRHHPENRKEDNCGPRQQDRMAHNPSHPITANPARARRFRSHAWQTRRHGALPSTTLRWPIRR